MTGRGNIIELREHIDRKVADLRREVRADLDRLSPAVGELVTRLERIEKKLRKGAGGGEGDDEDRLRPFRWDALEPAERAKRWGQLTTWIGDVLLVDYPVRAGRLPACWDRHPDAKSAVTACWLAWEHCHGPDAGLDKPAVWLRDFLPAMRTEVQDALLDCTHTS